MAHSPRRRLAPLVALAASALLAAPAVAQATESVPVEMTPEDRAALGPDVQVIGDAYDAPMPAVPEKVSCPHKRAKEVRMRLRSNGGVEIAGFHKLAECWSFGSDGKPHFTWRRVVNRFRAPGAYWDWSKVGSERHASGNYRGSDGRGLWSWSFQEFDRHLGGSFPDDYWDMTLRVRAYLRQGAHGWGVQFYKHAGLRQP